MKTRTVSCALVALSVCGSAALAQRFNIDIDSTGVPGSSFGAASGQAGVWNSYSGLAGGVPSALVDLTGAATGVTITMTSADGGSLLWFNNPTNTGDYAALMNDANQVGTLVQGGARSYTFNGLNNGMYTLYTYGAPPQGIPGLTTIDVLGSTSPNPQQTVGLAANDAFALGQTHAIHDVLVTNGTLTVIVSATPGVGLGAYINGFQLVPAPGAAAVLALGGLLAARRRR